MKTRKCDYTHKACTLRCHRQCDILKMRTAEQADANYQTGVQRAKQYIEQDHMALSEFDDDSGLTSVGFPVRHYV